jgi:hypothetical protein
MFAVKSLHLKFMHMESKINTINPESITYNTEELGYTILGGIRLEGYNASTKIANLYYPL